MSDKNEFQGTIAETADESTPWWPDAVNERKDAPNVVLIMLDDLGFAQLGSYGSTISTPNIDKLAEEGIRYNNFHTTALCSPSRASLLTGRNPHSSGVSFVTEVDNGFPNGRGKVRKDTALISEMLLEEGYNTFAVGKWHLAPAKEQKFTGPFDGWPLGRGFEHYYGFMRGATDQFYPELVEGNKRVSQPKSAEEGYHLTEDLTDKAIEYVKMQKSEAPEKPFFCYLSYAAPHAPHQAPQEFIDKYKGKFDKGWDQVREEWFTRQKELGIIPPNAVLPPSNPGVKPWEELGEEEKQLYARMQEAFAGFLEHTDYHIGRFFQCLEDIGQLENTMIIFLSDNGACGMGGEEGMLNNWTPTTNAVPETFESKFTRLEEIGGPNAKSHYPAGWAQAGNTPLRWYKTYTHAGGVRCPLIIYYPKMIKDKGAIRPQYHHISDITPTILELIDAQAPEVYKGIPQKPIYGTSLLYTLEEGDTPTRKKVQHYEVVGNRGIWVNGWKAIARHVKGTSFDEDVWELYDGQNDFSEINDLAETYPDKLKELVDRWWKEAEKYDVFPLDSRSIAEKIAKKPTESGPVHRTYYAHSAVFNSLNAPDLRNKSFKIQAELERISNEDGVIVAHGDKSGGYTLYIKNNHLVFHYNMSNFKQMTIRSMKELPKGSITVEFLLIKENEDQGICKLIVNGNVIGKGIISNISVLGFSKSLFCIGKMEGGSMSPEFESPFPFEGRVKNVIFTLGGYQEDLEAHVREELFSE